jgi:transposase
VKFTIKQFRETYPDDSACLDKIFRLRYGQLDVCPECGNKANFRRITTRRSYQCKQCYFQLYPTAGTIFEKTRTPLTYWFYAIYLMTATRNGVSAKELERQLGVTYKTAFRMSHKIRELMAKTKSQKLNGFVEIDESYIGSPAKGKRGRGAENKSIVFGMAERQGNVQAEQVENVKRKTLFKIIEKHVEKESHISTDEFPVYNTLAQLNYKHGIIQHTLDKYRDGEICTNSIEGFWSQLKRTVKGTHIHVSKKYLQNYINECSFRYNNRKSITPMFSKVLENLSPANGHILIPEKEGHYGSK